MAAEGFSIHLPPRAQRNTNGRKKKFFLLRDKGPSAPPLHTPYIQTRSLAFINPQIFPQTFLFFEAPRKRTNWEVHAPSYDLQKFSVQGITEEKGSYQIGLSKCK